MKNKKILIVIGIIVLVVLLIISFNIEEKDTSVVSENPDVILSNAEKESTEVKENEKKKLEEINLDKYIEYYEGNQKSVVLIARPTCHYCQIAEPIIQKISKEKDIVINYLNTDNFTEEDQTRFKESNEEFKEGFGTPMLLIIGDNEIKDMVDGLTDKYHYIKFLEDNGIIKKGE